MCLCVCIYTIFSFSSNKVLKVLGHHRQQTCRRRTAYQPTKKAWITGVFDVENVGIYFLLRFTTKTRIVESPTLPESEGRMDIGWFMSKAIGLGLLLVDHPCYTNIVQHGFGYQSVLVWTGLGNSCWTIGNPITKATNAHITMSYLACGPTFGPLTASTGSAKMIQRKASRQFRLAQSDGTSYSGAVWHTSIFFNVFFLYDLFVHTENWAPAAAYEALLFTLCATKAQIETWRQGEETSWKHWSTRKSKHIYIIMNK